MKEADQDQASYRPLQGVADIDPVTFAQLMESIESEPPGIYMLRIAIHPQLRPVAKMTFAAIILERIRDTSTWDFCFWLYVAALVRILKEANAAGVRVVQDIWMGLYDPLFVFFSHDAFWETGNEAMKKDLLTLVHLAIQSLDGVPEQLLVDFDKWKERIASIGDAAFRDAITLLLQDALMRHGYLK